jgi:amino acid transporter
MVLHSRREGGTPVDVSQSDTHPTDDQRLESLGYQPALSRRISGFTNFAISFSVISILAGPLTSYYIGFAYGGPVMMSWGWPFVSIMVTIVALAMAELASAMPTAGGLYYWACTLGSPAWGWFTGWLNFIGMAVGTAAVGWGAAVFVTAVLNLIAPSVFATSETTIFLVFLVLVVLAVLLNWFGVRLISLVSNVSAWWHIAGTAVLVLVLMVVPSHHQSVSFVFTKTLNASGFHAGSFTLPLFWLILGLGLLQAQYTIGGYDASAHLSEETVGASRKAAQGVYRSVVWSGVFGWILLLAVTFAVTNVNGTQTAGALDIQYIFQHALGTRWAIALLAVSAVAQVYCLTMDVTASSRILWALSRDRAAPFHRLLHRLNRFDSPAASIVAVALIAILLMVPTFWNGTIGYAVATSVSVIALYTAYALPFILRLRAGEGFARGEWSLGRWWKPVTIAALVWIVIIDILFLLPMTPAALWFTSSFSWTAANYTPLTLGGVLLLVGGWWLLSARKWFHGPIREVEVTAPLLEAPGSPGSRS